MLTKLFSLKNQNANSYALRIIENTISTHVRTGWYVFPKRG
ncbi:MAG: hypothetical protein ACI8SE_002295 [Bacteroidia bacterium]